MDNINNEITVDARNKISVNQATLECVIDTSASGSVSKLLSVSTDAVIDDVAIGGGITASGKLNAKVICLDASGTPVSYDYVSEFNEKFDCTFANDSAILSAKIIVLDVDSAIKNDKIVLQAITEISVFAETSETSEIAALSDCTAITKLSDVNYTKTQERLEKTFSVIEEYECGVNVDSVLFFDSGVTITNTKVSDGIFTVSGETAATVIYMSEGIISTKQFNVPFQEEINVKAEYGKACVTAKIADSKIVLVNAGDGNIMLLELNVCVSGSIVTEVTEAIVVDVCSATNSIDIEYTDIAFSRYKGMLCLKDKISGSALIDGEYGSVHKIIASDIARNCITNAYTGSGTVTVEGVMTANVIYEDNDTELRSVQIEMPYSLPFDTDRVSDGDEIDADAIVEILSTKVKRDSEIEVTALISISANVYATAVCRAVSKLEVGAKLEGELPAITFYQPTERDDLWSIAKAMLAPIDELIAQNPHLNESIGTKKVVYYRHAD